MCFRGAPYPNISYHVGLHRPTDPDFGGVYNLMHEHSMLYQPSIQATMPRNTFYISMLQEPLAQLRSAAKHYGIIHKLVGAETDASLHDVLIKFLSDPTKYEPKIVPQAYYKVRNHVTNMFGFEDWKDVDNPPEMDQLLRLKERQIFVVILEKLAESLILLKRRLCWSFKDILTLPVKKPQMEDSVEDLEMEHYHYNPGDHAIYDFFIRKIGYRIDDLDDKPDFWAEVKFYSNIQEKTQKFCRKVCKRLKGERDHSKLKDALSDDIKFERSPWDDSFKVEGKDCVLLMLGPDVYRNVIKVINYPHLCQTDTADTTWNIPKMYCQKEGYFKYSIPWKVITDPSQYGLQCV